MPPDFEFRYSEAELWTPLRLTPTSPWLQVTGRLRAGVSVAQARSALEIVAHQMEQEAPKDRAGLEDRGDAVERGAGGEVPADADLRAGRRRSGDVDRLRGCRRAAAEPRGTAAEGDRHSRFAGRRVMADRAAVAVREPGAGGDGKSGGDRGGASAVAASDEAAGRAADCAAALAAGVAQRESAGVQRRLCACCWRWSAAWRRFCWRSAPTCSP